MTATMRELWCALIFLCLLQLTHGTNVIKRRLDGHRYSASHFPHSQSLSGGRAKASLKGETGSENDYYQGSGEQEVRDEGVTSRWEGRRKMGARKKPAQRRDNDTVIITDFDVDQLSCGTFFSPHNLPLGLSNNIAGGYRAKYGEFPSFVKLDITRDWKKGFCGGTLISRTHVLTAAHCVNGSSAISVRPTIYHRPQFTEETYHAINRCTLPVRTIRGRELIYDIAILQLHKPVNLSPWVRVACLPKEPIAPNTYGVSVGLGSKNNIAQPQLVPGILQGLPVRHVKCDSSVNSSIDRPAIACFESYMPEHIGEICDGDSGGPVYVLKDGRQTVVAVSDFSYFVCAQGIDKGQGFMDVYSLINVLDDMIRECS